MTSMHCIINTMCICYSLSGCGLSGEASQALATTVRQMPHLTTLGLEDIIHYVIQQIHTQLL